MTNDRTSKYGPWAVVAGGSDGIGIAFAHGIAARGINVVLVARRVPVLEAAAQEIRAQHRVEVRTLALDLSEPDALAALERATSDLELGLFVYNAGGDDRNAAFLDKELAAHLALLRRNCSSVLEASYRFGAPMLARGRGGFVIVTSGAAWAGAATRVTYHATKAFDLILAEGLWAEWRTRGVDVLGLVVRATDTPSLRRALDAEDVARRVLDQPRDVAEQALEHLADGPTWIVGSDDPRGGSPFGALRRCDAVLAMSGGGTTKAK